MPPSTSPTARALAELAAELAAGHRASRATGAAGSFAALAIARVAAEVPAARRPLLVITPDEARAQELARDLGYFLPHIAAADDPAAPPRVLHLPAVEASPYAELSPDRRAIMSRQATLFRLSQGFGGEVLVASAAALARRVIPRAEFAALIDVLAAEEEIDRDATAALLARTGYGRTPVVEDPGTFAVRGGVIDVFPPLYRYPVRLELLGDLVESIRFFDPVTQRTMRSLDEVYLLPVRETVRTRGADPRARILDAADAAEHPSSKTRALVERVEAGEDFFGVEALTPAFHARMGSIDEYLPAGTALVIEDPEAVRAAIDDERERFASGFTKRRDEHRVVFPPEDFLLAPAEVDALLGRPARLELRPVDTEVAVALQVETHTELSAELRRRRADKDHFEEPLRPLVNQLRAWLGDGNRVVLVSPNRAHADRLESLLKGYKLEPRMLREPGAPELTDPALLTAPLTISMGPLAAGFRLPGDWLVVLTEDEIFGPRAHERKARTAKQRGLEGFGKVTEFSSLVPGDHVVHGVHGVGVYKGLVKLPVKGTAVDFLHLDYDGGALYLPVYRLSEVQRYVGADGAKPKIDKLGGITWEKTRSKVSKEVKQIAEDLLKLYAQRQALPGHAFTVPPNLEAIFQEFETRFQFEETEDQQKAIDAVLEDMAAPRPMDRLVCGDVGYGKTEVAMRAAMRAVMGGKQVAVLAPTTVLVEQHGASFRERMKDLPVSVDTLSRFKTKPEQLEVLKRAAEGKLDIVIGTHRLLSNDMRFKDLGLIVVDEEQRFGVVHKERLKQLRTQVDVLTLTATPIPRTMHMAMMGLREISIIATPPVDRRAIRTFVCRPDDDVLREGIQRELARGGQIFFVSHLIGEGQKPSARGDRSLSDWAEHLRRLVPGLRVAVAHGQMDSEALEQIMVDFVNGRSDVLCSTTIIESGLDIPRANTMFVSRADHFGLAQLYQLRGRIGRSRERAYCYLMVPPMEALTPEAKQRLAVLQRFTELGAGFQIASHDLEIRGAGDLLGAKQSGQIAAVGFETYTQILGEAVAELRGEAITRERDPELTVDLPTFIPDDYVSDTGQRLDLYKRLSSAHDEDEVRTIMEEIGDRYGAPPDEVRLYAELMILKADARKLGATAIDLADNRLSLALAEDTPLSPQKVLMLVNPGPGKPRSVYRLTPDMRLVRTFTPAEAADRLGAARKTVKELLESAT